MTWLLTSTGRQHYLTGEQRHARGNVPNLQEIAHSLAQINRFTGHCSRPYSVAEHSLFVCDIASGMGAKPIVQFAALMHDAHECITGDVASPIKQALGERWKNFEDEQQNLVAMGYGLVDVYEKYGDLIKHCDLVALATERRDLMPFDSLTHDLWPIIDTPGQEINPVHKSWCKRFSLKTWQQYADEFEHEAKRLMWHEDVAQEIGWRTEA